MQLFSWELWIGILIGCGENGGAHSAAPSSSSRQNTSCAVNGSCPFSAGGHVCNRPQTHEGFNQRECLQSSLENIIISLRKPPLSTKINQMVVKKRNDESHVIVRRLLWRLHSGGGVEAANTDHRCIGFIQKHGRWNNSNVIWNFYCYTFYKCTQQSAENKELVLWEWPKKYFTDASK